MSLASDYVTAYAASQTVAPPAPFVGPNGRAEVTTDGKMRLVQTASGGDFTIAAAGALAFRDWLTTTFG